MELHLLPIFLCLTLAPVAINAALPPELYWKSKLPNVTMPKAVKMLLSAGNDPSNQLLFLKSIDHDKLCDDQNSQFRVWTSHVKDQLRDDPNNQLKVWTSHGDQLPDDDKTTKFLFLKENDMHPEKKLEMLFTQSPYSKALISREVTDTLPFSLEKLPEILKMFSVKNGSDEGETIKDGIDHCTMPSNLKEEEKHCVASLESMVDYITSKFGTNVKAYATEVEKETGEYTTYTIAPGVKKLSDDAIACHQMHYPYALFNCHKVGNSNRVYFVPLEGSDGTRVKAIVVCHSNTSNWDAKHIAFRQLGIKPGDAVCHFSPADNVVWTPNN